MTKAKAKGAKGKAGTPRKAAKGSDATGGAPARRIGPDARAEAMRLLSLGRSLTSVAEELGVDRGTVRDWRDSPEGERVLNEARRARAAAFADAVEDARLLIRENLVRIVQVQLDKLDSPVPFEPGAAATALMDRGGLPKSTVVETTPPKRRDYSRMSDEQLAKLRAARDEYRRLLAEAPGKDGADGHE